jgi:hypothetical protein
MVNVASPVVAPRKNEPAGFKVTGRDRTTKGPGGNMEVVRCRRKEIKIVTDV